MHSNPHKYDVFTMTLHWLTAVLVIAAFIYGLGGSEAHVYLPARDGVRRLHETLGLAVFVVSLIRVVWALFRPRITPVPLPSWMHMASKATQGMLYLLLFAVPATAMAGAWLEGHPVVLLADITLPNLLQPSHDLGVLVSMIHTWLGDLILWIAGLHAAAAIYHHYWRKDQVLLSMLPRFSEKQ